MPAHNVFRWLDGSGWLVLSGGDTPESTIRARALGKIAADGGVAYVTMSGDIETAEKALDDLVELGAPSGYLVDIHAEDDRTIQSKLSEAGMVMIEASRSAAAARSLLMGAPIEGIQIAYENGAVVLAEELSTMPFGTWVTLETGDLKDGLEWLSSALIAPGVTDVAAWARGLLLEQPSAYAIGIGTGSALALGPAGEIETWGERRVTVALGAKFTRVANKDNGER